VNNPLFIVLLCAPWALAYGASDSTLGSPPASIYSRFELVASSEPVPLADMVSGWDGDYSRGELAYANGTFVAGFSYSDWFIQREQRHYYYLKFDKQTADFYRALELGQDLESDKKLSLDIKQFQALGVSIGGALPSFQFAKLRLDISASLALYQVGHFQFAELEGIAEAGDVTAASAVISYRYDKDRLLDHVAEVDKGLGFSLSTLLELDHELWSASLGLSDLANQFQWQDGAFTNGCINVGGGGQARCETEGAGSGISGQAQITESIPYTLNGKITHKNYDLSMLGMRHDAYYRLGLDKGFNTSLGRLGFFLYYPRLIGASWQGEYFDIQLGADRFQLSKARNIQFNLGINWHW
jgi:hypothetical protein